MNSDHSTELLSFLKETALFHDLTSEELTSLLPFIQTAHYESGEWVIQEGEKDHSLFIIQSGRAEVLKEDKQSKEPHLIGVFKEGDWFGEMAHIEQEQRAASVRAFHDLNVVILLLEELHSSPSLRSIYNKISSRLSKKMSERLRKTGVVLIQTLKEKIGLSQSSFQISKTMIYMLIIFGIFFNVVAIYNNYAGSLRTIINVIFMPTSIILFGIAAIRLIQISGYPLSFYGVSLKDGWRIGFEGFLATIPILALMALLKWALITQVPSLSNEPFLALIRPTQSPQELLIKTGIYLILVPLQELIVRGFLQSSFRNFYQGPNRVFYAILASNVMFEVLHTANDLFLALFSLICGIFWGALYEYQKTILGVIVSHILIGWWGIFALDLLSLAPTPAG
jgi:hypothetical protein